MPGASLAHEPGEPRERRRLTAIRHNPSHRTRRRRQSTCQIRTVCGATRTIRLTIAPACSNDKAVWRLTPQHCRHRAEAKRRRGVPKGKARQRRSGNAMLCAVRRCIHLQPRISEIDNHLQCLLCNVQLLFGLLPHFTIGLARMHTNVQVPFAESLRGYLGMPLDDTPNLNGA